MSANDELLEVFKGEVGEQLDELEERLAAAPSAWSIDRLFHLSHNIKGAGRMIGAGSFAEVAHGLEDLFSAIRGGMPVSDIATTVAREGAALLRSCYELLDLGAEPDVRAYGGRVATALGAEGIAATPSAEATAAAEVGEATEAASTASSSTIRVGVERLQTLMGLGSELVTSAHRSELRRGLALQLANQLAELRRRHPELVRTDVFLSAVHTVRELVRGLQHDGVRSQQLSDQLQDAIRQLRMVRVDTVRGMLARAVRSAAEATGRQVEFRTHGGDTEIDRAILERLRDPLVHLVRNAVAHGIEDPSDRTRAGKSALGVVTFSAVSAGSWVEIIVEDDGRGVDAQKVRRKAVTSGALDASEASSLGNDEVLDLLFRPGFSTAEQVSELAGRGFGMDIVRTNLTEIGGSVSIASTPGRGAAVRLRVPLTRLTIRGLVVKAAGQPMAFPMMGVERAVAVRRSDIRTVDAVEVISVEGALVPVSHVGKALSLEGAVPEASPAVVVAEGNRQRAFLVDEILGERELTIQALPWNLAHAPGVAGASVMESGDVLLVLNTHELVGSRSTAALHVADSDLERAAHQYRILVVDDSVTSRTLEKNILTSAGYEVLMAVDGQEALKTLRDHPVDLVVTDVEMPHMNGIELTRAIRSSKGLEELPVILVTSLGSEQDRQRGADAGADAHIVKGAFDQDELLKAVSRLL